MFFRNAAHLEPAHRASHRTWMSRSPGAQVPPSPSHVAIIYHGDVQHPNYNSLQLTPIHPAYIRIIQNTESAVQRTPPEIWLSIFEHATFVPHAFDTDATDPFDVPSAPHAFDRVGQEELRASLTTKRALVLVCRRWHALATPMLYQAVSAGDNRTLQHLHDTLEHFAQDHRHMGRTASVLPVRPQIRIHRFDLLTWSRSDLDPSPRAFPKPDILARLISYMPDLEVFCELVDLPPYDDATGVLFDSLGPALDALLAHCAMSLRKCILGSYCTVPVDYYVALRTGRGFPRLSCLFSSYTMSQSTTTSTTTGTGTATSESAADTEIDSTQGLSLEVCSDASTASASHRSIHPIPRHC
ncbi:hypothetical protein EVG20_g9698 [Dentipellis fragilis]|uniref:Uncharacterized protein n=1 Tax=Dentipellis fragilis TaxID=205917 RepID=A0A4Y9XXD8_9AGAM|nr:hypothetical protein EVG20_g9698 [Dentipellis fragilis]